ncbi:hypothetical protein FAVG1_12831 [Fusarium avenaceum]|nr:hypothetical protein FAVG1_12831 [Fusarium avenaceum]
MLIPLGSSLDSDECDVVRIIRHINKPDLTIDFEIQWADGDTRIQSEYHIQQDAPDVMYDYWEEQGGRIEVTGLEPFHPFRILGAHVREHVRHGRVGCCGSGGFIWDHALWRVSSFGWFQREWRRRVVKLPRVGLAQAEDQVDGELGVAGDELALADWADVELEIGLVNDQDLSRWCWVASTFACSFLLEAFGMLGNPSCGEGGLERERAIYRGTWTGLVLHGKDGRRAERFDGMLSWNHESPGKEANLFESPIISSRMRSFRPQQEAVLGHLDMTTISARDQNPPSPEYISSFAAIRAWPWTELQRRLTAAEKAASPTAKLSLTPVKFKLTGIATQVSSGKPLKLTRRAWGGFDERPTTAKCYEQERTAFLLTYTLGPLGVDQFYAHRWPLAVFKLLTLGAGGIWWFVDVVLWALRATVKNIDEVNTGEDSLR